MCETEKQMREVLVGQKSTSQTKAIMLLAQDYDKNMKEINEKFDGIAKKIADMKSDILKAITSHMSETNEKIEKLSKETKDSCFVHKAEIRQRLEKVDETTEVLKFFTKHPKLLLGIAIALIALIFYALGSSQVFNIFKIL